MIEELIQLARDLREANAGGEARGLAEDELAFGDALETNDRAVRVLVSRIPRKHGYPPEKRETATQTGAGTSGGV